MASLFHTQHGGTLMDVPVSVEGFFLTMKDSNNLLDWEVPAFPLGLYESLLDILHGKDFSSFMCDRFRVSGELQRLPPAREEQVEKFVMFKISMDDKYFEIKLRDTEVLKFYEALVQYWTC